MKLFWTKIVLFLFFQCFKAAISKPGKFFNCLTALCYTLIKIMSKFYVQIADHAYSAKRTVSWFFLTIKLI